MKTSNKLLLGGVILITITILACITIFGVSNRAEASSFATFASKTLTYKYSDLKKIKLEGVYNIEYIQGSKSLVELTIPENSEKLFKISQSNNAFSVSYKPQSKMKVEVKITAPNIEKIDLQGKSNLHFSKLNLENLNIKSQGIVKIQSDKGYIKNLNIDGEGMGNFELKNLIVKNCDFNFEGMGSTKLYLDGGTLSGHIEGMMNVKYYGKVSNSSLKIEGMGRIKDNTN